MVLAVCIYLSVHPAFYVTLTLYAAKEFFWNWKEYLSSQYHSHLMAKGETRDMQIINNHLSY